MPNFDWDDPSVDEEGKPKTAGRHSHTTAEQRIGAILKIEALDGLIPEDETEALLINVLRAWIRFRVQHDLARAEMSCCSVSREFFAALQAYEDGLLPEDAWHTRT